MQRLIWHSCRLGLALVLGSLLVLSGGNTELAGAARMVLAEELPPCPPEPATPGVPPPFPCDDYYEDEPLMPGEVCMSLYADPDGAPLPDHVVTYWLLVANDSFYKLNYTSIDFPFDPAQQVLLDFSTSDPRAWVSAVQTDNVTVEIESLRSWELIEIGLQFAIMPDVPLGTTWHAKATASLPGLQLDFPVASNRVDLIVAESFAADEPQPLFISRDGSGLRSVEIASDKFAPFEFVSLWYHLPDGEIVELYEVIADQYGQVTTTIDLEEEAGGTYWLVAYGHCSDVTAAGSFTFGP